MDRICILDRSGSMSSCASDTIGGYNTFVNGQKTLGGTLSLYLFDHEIIESYKDKNIDDVEEMTSNTFVPRGSTSLFDAIGKVLTTHVCSSNTMIIILTDGLENSSKNYSKNAIKDLIKLNTKLGATFMYIGANQDAFQEGSGLGIDRNNIMEFDSSGRPESQSPFEAVTQCIRHRSTGDYSTPLTPSQQI